MFSGFWICRTRSCRSIVIKNKFLKKRYGLNVKVVAVADSSGAALNQNGLNLEKLLKIKQKTGKVSNYPNYGVEGVTALEVLDEIDYDCLVEMTPTNITDGEPARKLTIKAIKDGKDVVTSNKGHLALYFPKLMKIAKKNNVKFKFEASVGGAMPIINFAKYNLPSCSIESIIGILNGTTNFILSRMASEGSSYEQALKEAQELGIAETDPTYDVEGIDAACKSVILANSIMELNCTLEDVDITGITNITPEAIDLAKDEGYLIKLIAEISKDRMEVSPRLVDKNSPLAVDGTLNVAMLKTDLAKNITVMGRGAGPLETASAILTDIINIWREK